MPQTVGLGVDFGTSHTVAVVRHDDGTSTPLLFDGSPLLSSAVFAEETGSLLTGADANHSARLDPASFEPHPKRLIDDGSVLLGEHEFEISAVFAAVLSRVRSECQRVTGTVPATTITHPAAWGPTRKQVLEDAAVSVGFPNPVLVPEPVAAATHFVNATEVNVDIGAAVVVYDFGGGTFDASVVRRTGEGFEVLAVDGSSALGGVDIDHALVEHLGGNFDNDPRWQRLLRPETTTQQRHRRAFYDDVRSAKERLSRRSQVAFPVPVLDIDTHVTREELDAVTHPLLLKAVRITRAVIRAAKVSDDEFAGVFLVGGASRMPLASTVLHRETGMAPTILDHPELVVATGAVHMNPAPQAIPEQRQPETQPEPGPETERLEPATPPPWVPLSQMETNPAGETVPRRPLIVQTLMGVQAAVGLCLMVPILLSFIGWITGGDPVETRPNVMFSITTRPMSGDLLMFALVLLSAVAHAWLAVTALRMLRRDPREWRRALFTLLALLPLITAQFAIWPLSPRVALLIVVPELVLVIGCAVLLQRKSYQSWFQPAIDPNSPTETGAINTQRAQLLMWIHAGLAFGLFGFTLAGQVTHVVFPDWYVSWASDYIRDDGVMGFAMAFYLAAAVIVAVSATRMNRPRLQARRWGLFGLYSSVSYVAFLGMTGERDTSNFFIWGIDNANEAPFAIVLAATWLTALASVFILHKRGTRAWLSRRA